MIGVPRPTRQALLWLSLATVSLLPLGVRAASASTAQEESQGAEVLRELEAGKTGAFGSMGMMGGGGKMGGGGMMGGGYWNESNAEDNGSDGPSAAAMVGMMAVLIGAVAGAVLLLSRRRPRGPLDTLKRRFAAGEISSEDYEKRRRLLEGS